MAKKNEDKNNDEQKKSNAEPEALDIESPAESLADDIIPDISAEQAESVEATKSDKSDSEVTLSDINDPENTSVDNSPVTVQSVKFASFEDEVKPESEQNKNLDILMDIKLQLTVELGRTELSVKKVLELTRGSIVELEKVAGEPVELFANGKLVAQGEVVVIEDNFGLRITSITDPEDRLKGLK